MFGYVFVSIECFILLSFVFILKIVSVSISQRKKGLFVYSKYGKCLKLANVCNNRSNKSWSQNGYVYS